jgi:hypothetical protein
MSKTKWHLLAGLDKGL